MCGTFLVMADWPTLQQ